MKFFRILRKNYLKLRRASSKLNDLEIADKIDFMFDHVRRFYSWAIPALALIVLAFLIYDIGYNEFYEQKFWLYNIWRGIYWTLAMLFMVRLFFNFGEAKLRVRLFAILLIALIISLQYLIKLILGIAPTTDAFVLYKVALFLGTCLLVFVEGSNAVRRLYQTNLNPALLFVGSFLLLIITGTFLLMLPNATTTRISPIDAWFTSASAVCVTGLIVVDTATVFTTFGKVVIITLIQIGGLGIMTFAGILGYLAAGSVSMTNQVALKDMLSSDRLGNVMGFVGRVVVVTLSFEAIGGVFIYLTIPSNLFESNAERLFFSIFHGVSAFCNAGFSTLSLGLYDESLRFNYSLQCIIMILVVLGGLGFPIVFNIARHIQIRAKNIFFRLMRVPVKEYLAHVLHTSSRLALTTTGVLLLTGFVAYLIFEQNATLSQHPTFVGKIVTSFFGSVTPRTAGFNTVDITQFSFPTIMIYFLLMYIGASPGSTGGGIKTTVAAVAFLNMKSIIVGKPRTEAFRTEISHGSINRAFAIIILSLLVLGISIVLIVINDIEKGFFRIAFEVFSAFSTVGLSLGITADLSPLSKIILSLVMLIGRVGTITLLVAFIRPTKEKYYRYPTEDVLL